jgi:2-aminomuconate deaminase
VRATFLARRSLTRVKPFKNRRELSGDIRQLEKFFVQLLTAFFANPDESIEFTFGAFLFNHQPDRIGRTARRMRRVGREQKNIAFGERNIGGLAVLQNLENDVAFQLIEKFLAAVHMIISAAIRAANHHNDEIAVFPDALVANRRLKQVAVLVNPLLEIDRRGEVRHTGIQLICELSQLGMRLPIKSICYYCGLLRFNPTWQEQMVQKSTERVPINVPAERAPGPLGNYSHAVRAGNLLFVSGMGARDATTGTESGITVDEEGNVTSYDIEVQTRAVLHNLQTVLTEAGCTLQNVVDVTVFLADMKDFDKYNRVYGKYFNFTGPPARTTIQAAKLPGKNFIEIKAIALCP